MRKFLTVYQGFTLNDRDTDCDIYRVAYGELRSVYASQACNYSYREFWF
jgi:hypothetical protein